MTVKLTLQGGLIYLTLLFIVATLAAAKPRHLHLRYGFWFAGFLTAVASLVWRGLHTGHPPMQNLFEFFLCMSVALFPLSIWSFRHNRIHTVGYDALLGVIILIPAGFILSEELRPLPPALQSQLFIPHVASYVAGYVMLARAALLSLSLLHQTKPGDLLHIDQGVLQSVAAGFVLITAGLLLGAVWGKLCWGDYWHFDPKETWSLATWLLYGGYFHYRLKWGTKYPGKQITLLWIGLIFIILTLTWINLARIFAGLHNYA